MRCSLVLWGVVFLYACGEDAAAVVDAGDASSDAHAHEDGASVMDASDATSDDAATLSDAAADAEPTSDGGHDADVASDSGGDAAVDGRVFEIAFRGVLGGTDVACGTQYSGFGPADDQSITIKDFRFYVHGVELIRDDDVAVPLTLLEEAPYQRSGVALLDFEDKTVDCVNGTSGTHTVVRGTAPDATYTGIRFVVGVPLDQNHQDRSVALAPLDLSQLFWSWAGGYIFARFDLYTVAVGGGARSTFSVHLGSTGCNGSPSSMPSTSCTYENRPTISFADFDPDHDVVLVDPKAVVEGLDLTVNTPTTAIGCMSARNDPECDLVMPRLGIDFGSTPGAQVLFRVAP